MVRLDIDAAQLPTIGGSRTEPVASVGRPRDPRQAGPDLAGRGARRRRRLPHQPRSAGSFAMVDRHISSTLSARSDRSKAAAADQRAVGMSDGAGHSSTEVATRLDGRRHGGQGAFRDTWE
jgi:hypothetical protein